MSVATLQEQLKDLASLVIECLDAQREYFKSRDGGQLATCKQIESRLRKSANAIVNPPAASNPTLFD